MTATVVVVGDCLLDEDVLAAAERLSPDGPVPVLDERERRRRAGGAALAARLAADAGAQVVLITPLTSDADGAVLRSLIDSRVEVCALPASGETAVKTRLRAGGQTVARLDRGAGPLAVADWTHQAAAALARADAVLVADYGRGVTTDERVRAALAETARRLPVVWDPHPRGGPPVAGAALVTPNAVEAASTLGAARALDLGVGARQAERLVRRWEVRSVAVTVGARGAVLASDIGAVTAHPVRRAVDGDACGAGDAFAAAAAVALAAGAVPSEAVTAAVAGAGAFLAAGGVAALGSDTGGSDTGGSDTGGSDTGGSDTGGSDTGGSDDRAGYHRAIGRDDAALEDRIARVRAAGGTVVATGGCFDLLHAGHVATLEAARALGDLLVVCLNSDESVQALKGTGRPLQSLDDRRRVLEALRAVDAVVVFEESTPDGVLQRLRPDLWVKGGDYSPATLPETELVRSWGGQVVCVPYLPGRSTSELVELARR